MPPRKSHRQRDAAIQLADVLVKTLTSSFGPAGTFVGELAGKGFDLLAGRSNAEQDKLKNQIADIADAITSTVLDSYEFARIPENDVDAAIIAVAETIESTPIDGKLLRDSGWSALGLADYYRNSARDLLERAGLGDAEYAYVRILQSVSHQVVGVLRSSAEVHAVALADITGELQAVWRRLHSLGGIHSETQSLGLDEYLLTYRLHAGDAFLRSTCSTTGLTTRRVPLRAAYVDRLLTGPNGAETLDALLEHLPRIVVECDAGHGKTMLLRQTFLRLLAGHDDAPVPIYLDLHGLGELPDWDTLISLGNKWLPTGPVGWVDQLIRDGRAVILLDAVDDLLGGRPGQRISNENDLDNFLSSVTHPSRVVIAARPGTFDREWVKQNGFVVATIDPPTTEQVFEQVERWHAAVASEIGTGEERNRIIARGRQLTLAFCRVSDLRGIGRDPLLCTLMCEAFLDSALSLPGDWISLVQDVLNRLADRDCRTNDPLMSGRSTVRDLQQEIAVFAVHNSPPFDVDHLGDALGKFTASEDPIGLVKRILARCSFLSRGAGGLAFVNEYARDHLAAGELVVSGNVKFLLEGARTLARPRLIVAAAGHGRKERATELIAGLLDDAETHQEIGDALIVMAYCGANAALSLDPETYKRAVDAVTALVHRGDATGIIDPAVAPLAMDMLIHVLRSGKPEPAAMAMIPGVAARAGESAHAVLQMIAKELTEAGLLTSTGDLDRQTFVVTPEEAVKEEASDATSY